MEGGDLVEVDLDANPVKNLDRWMENLPPSAQVLPLHCLAIPGSHDSVSSSITPHSDIAPDDPQLYNSWFIRATSCISRHVIYNWCRTQSLDSVQQLESGIRYFDLRVALNSSDNSLYIVHGLYGTQIENVLKSMKKFLDGHTKEVVLLDFQHFYDMTQLEHHKLIYLLTEIFGPMLCPYIRDLTEFTLTWLWERGFQVVVFYRNPVAQYHPFLWPSECLPNPWPNTTSMKSLLSFLTAGYERGREAGKFYVSQCILTPTLFFIFRHFFGNLRNVLACSTNKEVLKWLEDKHPGPRGLNIVICDFVDINDCSLPRNVISLNYKL